MKIHEGLGASVDVGLLEACELIAKRHPPVNHDDRELSSLSGSKHLGEYRAIADLAGVGGDPLIGELRDEAVAAGTRQSRLTPGAAR